MVVIQSFGVFYKKLMLLNNILVNENEVIKKIAYEVSISKMERVSQESEETHTTSEEGAV